MRVVHLELHTGDRDAAAGLYSQLCGWAPEEVRSRHGEYLALRMGNELGGGVVECPVRRPLWLPYVEVPDISAAVGQAQDLGATVLLEPREGPHGWRSVIATAAGGELAFWQGKS
jgi:predicted enzyme related to lactoylglutathione lyase